MATLEDVLARTQEHEGVVVEDDGGRFSASVPFKGKIKGYCWTWLERHDPKKARVPNREVLAIYVSGLAIKDALLSEPKEYWVEDPHYNGYPAVIVRLPLIPLNELHDLLDEAFLTRSQPVKKRSKSK
ncbi:MAG: hypothetical protein J0L72_11240 [Armatimonadetes bacterium]|nr:hypothetical protein [Armatimonadota bacterium]